MKKLLLISFLLLPALQAVASHANKMFMKRPVSTWTNYPAGLRDAEIEVTPLGAYARIDLTFSVGPTSVVSPTDSQEAVIFFDLPAGSYVHDSWLWLNPTTIISAELMERKKASEVYANIVKRRRDPSLLTNVLSQEYQLNIYPVASGYWRKVKITYSTPILWQAGKGHIPLPMELMAASSTPPSVALKVNTNGVFVNPAFSDGAFTTSWISGTSANSIQLAIPASAYTGNEQLSLAYDLTFSEGSRLSTYPTGANEGIYELITLPAATPAPAPRYVNLVVDAQTSKEMYSSTELRRIVTHYLRSSLRPTDFFNIYYRNAAGSTSAFTTWHRADSTGIGGIGPAFASAPPATILSYLALIKDAARFSAAGPANTETIILNNSAFFISTSNIATYLADLQSVPGISNRKMDVINYSFAASPGQTGLSTNFAAFNELLQQFAAARKGSYIFPQKFFYDAYTNTTAYDLNIGEALHQLQQASGFSTAYQTSLPVSGFTFGTHAVGIYQGYNPQSVYAEVGRYYGNMVSPDSVTIQYADNGTIRSYKTPVSGISPGIPAFKQAWTFFNNKELAAYGTRYQQQIIDSSVANRVLSDYTAFLALETGDTIRASVSQSPQGGYIVSVINGNYSSLAPQTLLKAYPNPFSRLILLEHSGEINDISIYNVSGSLIFTKKLERGIYQWAWDGTDASGASVPDGIYLIRVSSGSQSTVVRVSKRG